ncbi:MAG: gliding motility lipoprotein GldH [Mediterranea sp.]|jgi:gliding motility-associated lipoprotein GldH|nr:gliding motility lipoprotein GldH [Mediterranea sp.]
MRSLPKSNLLVLALALLVAACDTPVVYHSYHALPVGGWAKDDTLVFPLSVADTLPATFRLFVEVRNNTAYPYRDLSLVVAQNLEDSTVTTTDTLVFALADSTGLWTGRGWGSLYQSETFVRDVRTQGAGIYTVAIRSGMSDERLMGVNDVGVRLEK